MVAGFFGTSSDGARPDDGAEVRFNHCGETRDKGSDLWLLELQNMALPVAKAQSVQSETCLWPGRSGGGSDRARRITALP